MFLKFCKIKKTQWFKNSRRLKRLQNNRKGITNQNPFPLVTSTVILITLKTYILQQACKINFNKIQQYGLYAARECFSQLTIFQLSAAYIP